MPLRVAVVPCLSDNYGYVIQETESGTVAVVDAPEAEPLIRALDAVGGVLDFILITHHHPDHVDGVEALVKRYGARTVGNAHDAARLPKLDVALEEGDAFTLGSETAEILDVSGHTIGHIAYVFPDAKVAFTADSLMALGCGRVFEGTHLQMWESLQKLMKLDPQTQIYSGHNYGAANGRFALSIEPENEALKARVEDIRGRDQSGAPIVPATLAEELATNPFLRAGRPEVKAAVGLPDADDAAVFAEVRRRKDDF